MNDVWMPQREEEWGMEQDAEYFQQMCPAPVRKLQETVEQVCGQLDYDGSLLYDVFPDRVRMMHVRDRALSQARDDGTLFGPDGYFGDRAGQAVKDLADVLLYWEVCRRRCRRRGAE